jgi:hypothetical protein
MDATTLLGHIVGPWGATFLLLVAVIYLWRKLEAAQLMLVKQQDLFEQALKVIRDDLVPLVREMAKRQFAQ